MNIVFVSFLHGPINALPCKEAGAESCPGQSPHWNTKFTELESRKEDWFGQTAISPRYFLTIFQLQAGGGEDNFI